MLKKALRPGGHLVVVDGLRGGYPDERESRWYPGDSGYGDRYEDERYRVPEPRHAGPETDPLDPRVPVGPRSGVELPPLPTYEPEPGYPPAAADTAGEAGRRACRPGHLW